MADSSFMSALDSKLARFHDIPIELSVELDRTTMDRVNAAAAGLDEIGGTMPPEVTAKAFDQARADVIAATEVTRAVTAGETALVVALGIPATALWHTALDDRVCEVCEPLDGVGREVYGMVSPDGPPAHPNCRCFLDWMED